MAESNAHKKHLPTARRLLEARRRGEVPHAADTVSAAALIAATLASAAIAPLVRERFGGWIDTLLALSRRVDDPAALAAAMRIVSTEIAPLLVAIAGLPAIAALVVAFVISGPVLSGQPLAPRAERVSPAAGLRRIFSALGLFNVVKGLVGVTVSVATAVLLLRGWVREVAGLWQADASGALATVTTLLLLLSCVLAVATLVLSVPDLIFQRWHFLREKRMDDTELKREQKDQSGDPEQKAERKRLHRDV